MVAMDPGDWLIVMENSNSQEGFSCVFFQPQFVTRNSLTYLLV